MARFHIVIGHLLMFLTVGVVWAQIQPRGGEFQVNTYTTGDQLLTSVAIDEEGDFIVVWRSAQDGSSTSIHAQLFASDGMPVGDEFQVNAYTTSGQTNPRVAMDAAGHFVAVYSSFAQDGADFGVFGRRFASDGSALNGEFQVNTYTTGAQVVGGLGAESNGDFVVTWGSSQDGSATSVHARRYASDGTALDDEFQINIATYGYQNFPDLAVDGDGDFIVAWQSNPFAIETYVSVRRFDSDGAPAPLVILNADPMSNRIRADSATNGEFVVLWHNFYFGGSDLQARRYNADGDLVRSFVEPNALPIGSGIADDGEFVVVWSDAYTANPNLFARRYDSQGLAVGQALRVNSYTPGNQASAEVAMNDAGDFVVVWSSDGDRDGSGRAVFAQRFSIDREWTTIFADGFESGDTSMWSGDR